MTSNKKRGVPPRFREKREMMNNVGILQSSFAEFNRATSLLRDAYDCLQRKFGALNLELEKKNRELEDSLSEKEAMRNFLGNVLNNLTTGVVVSDMNHRIREMNLCAESIFETGGQRTGERVEELFRDVPEDFLRSLIDRALQRSETGLRLPSNGKTLEVSGSYLRDGSGRPVGKIFLVRDVTRLGKLEEMVKRNEKITAMGELAANFAHEIRNPLGSIELFSSMLLKDLKSKRDRDRVGHIMHSVKRMNRKITDLLSFTETVRIPEFESLDLHRIIEEVNAFILQIVDSEEISVNVRLACDDPVIRGSREMLKHVFLNLYLNAVQAIEKRGTIEIETRHSELFLREEGVLPTVEIRFSDDGTGISPDVLEKIFDPLFSTRESGSGLGLASVHRIIQMHGGLIHAENGSAGRTVFTVLLPLAGSDRPCGGLNS